MEKKEIMREALVELGKIMVEAFDRGLNMDCGTREANTDEPWVTGSLTMEGWTKLPKEAQDDAYWTFQLYPHHTEGEVREKLDEIRERIREMSKYEVRNAYIVALK